MKPSTSRHSWPGALESRLADYQRQVNAYLATRGSREESEAHFASGSPLTPDLAAPGFVSFTGGASRQSANAGAPRDISPTQAAFYAELDENIASPKETGT